MNVVPMAYMLMRNKNKSSLEEDNFTQNLKLSLQFSTTVFIIQSKITRLKKKGGGGCPKGVGIGKQDSTEKKREK